MFYLMLEYSMTYQTRKSMQKKNKKSQHIKLVSIYALEINWFIIHDIEFIHATYIFIYKNIFLFSIFIYI